MSNFTRVYFPGLGIDFDLPSVAFTIGSYDIHFYGIIIAFGFMLAVLYGGRMAYKWRMSLDGMTDVLIWGTVFGIVCARAYYVILSGAITVPTRQRSCKFGTVGLPFTAVLSVP